ncbi:hypothetical protein Tcan_17407 [Toxocara canis]|uniref:Uncharacterized protein n=1 Tax=Toxocara canis TaxID=6265 RepID=A0A0B2W0A8_TOXCA|nr:hypothetical protein Tcan_17407 [Toxocara canis]
MVVVLCRPIGRFNAIVKDRSTIYQQPVGSSGLAQMKASPLKRKTALSQTAQTAHELPSKLAHVTQTPQYTPYQQPSPQYQQPIASPQFPAQSTTPVNRLSPYGGYDGSQNGMCALNGMGQWSKRPPSRSELIRMELRHSLQARQHGASPNHSGVLSPNDLGAPRFAGVPAYTQMMSPPRMTPQSPSQLVQQQPGMTNAQQIVVPQSQPSQQNLTAAYYMPTEGAPIISLSAPNHYPTAAPSMNEPNTICITQTPVIPTELYDFNLGNGGFDMDSDATRSLVQKLLS